MSRTALVLWLLLLTAVLFPQPLVAAEATIAPEDPAACSRFLIRGDDPLVAAWQDGQAGFKIVLSLPQINAVVVEMEAGRDLASAGMGDALLPDVATVAAAEMNDPILASGRQWAPQRIQAPDAWEKTGGEGVVVAIVDSGIDPNHPELRDRLVAGYNFWEGNADTSDRCGHGTHVAGIVAAAGHNGEGIAGIAHDAKLMPVKVMADGCYGTYSKLIAGILYAVDAGARIIVITSGAYIDNPMLHDAVAYAYEHGALVIGAAGNDSTDLPFYPAAYDEVVAVAGADPADGSFIRSNFGTHIDLAAPATDIVSTYWANGQSTYAVLSGTSMAAPHVAGTAALALALDPTLPLAKLVDSLYGGADDCGAPGWDPSFGYGRTNAWHAVQAVLPADPNTLTVYLPALLGE